LVLQTDIHDAELHIKAYQLIVKKLQNKIVCYKETADRQHLIFWPESHGRVNCHTAKFEPNVREGFSRRCSLVSVGVGFVTCEVKNLSTSVSLLCCYSLMKSRDRPIYFILAFSLRLKKHGSVKWYLLFP
jgi:hypothetical protein